MIGNAITSGEAKIIEEVGTIRRISTEGSTGGDANLDAIESTTTGTTVINDGTIAVTANAAIAVGIVAITTIVEGGGTTVVRAEVAIRIEPTAEARLRRGGHETALRSRWVRAEDVRRRLAEVEIV